MQISRCDFSKTRQPENRVLFQKFAESLFKNNRGLRKILLPQNNLQSENIEVLLETLRAHKPHQLEELELSRNDYRMMNDQDVLFELLGWVLESYPESFKALRLAETRMDDLGVEKLTLILQSLNSKLQKREIRLRQGTKFSELDLSSNNLQSVSSQNHSQFWFSLLRVFWGSLQTLNLSGCSLNTSFCSGFESAVRLLETEHEKFTTQIQTYLEYFQFHLSLRSLDLSGNNLFSLEDSKRFWRSLLRASAQTIEDLRISGGNEHLMRGLGECCSEYYHAETSFLKRKMRLSSLTMDKMEKVESASYKEFFSSLVESSYCSLKSISLESSVHHARDIAQIAEGIQQGKRLGKQNLDQMINVREDLQKL